VKVHMKEAALLAAVLLTLPTVCVAQSSAPRLETSVFFTFAKLERIGSTDHGPGTSTAGLGGRIGWRLLRHMDVEGELSVHPRAGVSGYRVQGFAGAKIGTWFGRLGVHAKARPGFLYFEKDPFGVAAPGSRFPRSEWAASVEPALDLGAIVQYVTPGGVFVRLDFGKTIVRYDSRTVVSSQLLPPFEQGGFTTRNRQWSIGVGKRF
jgi:hypothetical protein